MKNDVCSKHYPKSFQDETSIDAQGFAIYRHRNDGRYITKNVHRLDNRYVVPYNIYLLKKYQAHISTEWCNKTRVVKYLFKYCHKGQSTLIGCSTDVETQHYSSELRCKLIVQRSENSQSNQSTC